MSEQHFRQAISPTKVFYRRRMIDDRNCLPRDTRVPIVSVAARHALYAKARMWARPIVFEHAHRTPIDAVALDPECDSVAARRYR